MNKALAMMFALAISTLPLASYSASPENPLLERGEEVYGETCANSFCHGVGGIAASAPRLAARDFDALYIASVTANGVPDTPMAGFANALPAADLNAVLTYVARLNGILDPQFSPDNPLAGLGIEVANPRQMPLAGSAQQGRELFFDAYDKGISRCSTCHEIEGRGIPVAAPIITIPASVTALHNIETPAVQRAVLANESMPALLLSRGVAGTIFYDLTSVPPVLRTIQPDQSLAFETNPQWKHNDFLQSYSNAELERVLNFLRAVIE